MRRVTDTIAALWAAVWVRWELMRARRSRRAAGRREDDFVLPMMSVPVEGVDYDPIELDPALRDRLAMTAAELLSQDPITGESPSRRRTSLRAVAATVGAALAVAVVGASASALIAGTTGVPAMDRLVGIWESGVEKGGDRPAPAPQDIRPAKAGPTLDYAISDRSAGQVVSYVGRSGQVCMVGTLDSGATGAPACESLDALAATLKADGVEPLQLDAQVEGVAVFGLVGGDVDRLEVAGPQGALRVELGDAWKPAGSEGAVVRPFVAHAPLRGDGTDRDRVVDALTWSEYEFEVVRAGETTVVTPD